MTTIIDSIKEWGIPVTSHFEAQRNLQKNMGDYSQSQYEMLIKELTEVDLKTSSQKEAQLIAHYLVIDSVKDFNNNITHLPAEALEIARTKTRAYLAKNGWVIATDEVPAPTVNAAGEEVPAPAVAGKKRTGPSKKEQALELFNKDGNSDKGRKELIEIFMKELGLTQGGASTYVHNCKKGLWK